MSNDTPTADDGYNGSSLVATAVLLLVFTWTSVSLRTYTRIALTKNFYADDWLMLISQARSRCPSQPPQPPQPAEEGGFCFDPPANFDKQGIFITSCSLILAGVHVGLGRHDDAISNADHKVQALMVRSA